MFTNVLKSMFGKALLAAAVLGGALCFAGASSAQADERDRDRVGDRDRIVRYDDHRDYRFHEDVRRGYYSDRDDYGRHERREAFARGYYDRFGCWHRY